MATTKERESAIVRKRNTAKRTSAIAEMKPAESQPMRPLEPQRALTINIQSWATPIIGLGMLVIGLLFGYFLRPLTLAQATSAQVASAATSVVISTSVAIPTADQTAARQALMDSVIPKVRHFKGDASAPVTMIEFGDFQCPFCGRYASATHPQITDQYISTGKVRFGFFNFAFLGSESTWAAEAAECASDQDKYWEYHEKLYGSQAGENQGAFNKDNLKKLAEDLGLNSQTFNDCLDSGKYTALIQSDTSLSSSLGVQSTPTFLINGQSVVGAQPFEVFQQTIESLLK